MVKKIARTVHGLQIVWDGEAVYLQHGAKILEVHPALTIGSASEIMRKIERDLDVSRTAMC